MINVHQTAVIDDGAEIGINTSVWHFTHICSRAKLGDNCIVGQNCFIADNVVIGNGVKIQNNVSIYDGVWIEDDVFIGPSVVFTNVINPRSFINRRNEFKKTIVKKGASIGANATIVCGNSIGQYALVGAGAVVTRPVRDFETVVGNPARHKNWISRRGHALRFNEDNKAICPESHELYILTDNHTVILHQS